LPNVLAPPHRALHIGGGPEQCTGGLCSLSEKAVCSPTDPTR
jgi:hypothetical protein